jgi:hypothetical protein
MEPEEVEGFSGEFGSETDNHQCRQRWFFYLDPKINRPLTDEIMRSS